MKPLVLISSSILLASLAASLALEPSPVLVKDIQVGSGGAIPDFSRPKTLGNAVLFAATNGTSGYELWQTDGTEAGTSLLKDIYTGSKTSEMSFPIAAGSTLYFAATDSSGRYLWKSDGTAAGTVKVTGSAGNPGANPQLHYGAGNIFYFTATSPATGYELWRSDGSTAGTRMVADINPGTAHSSTKAGVAIGNIYYFTASDGVHGAELWRTDGTASGTSMVKDICPPEVTTAPSSLTMAENTLYFLANDGVHGLELWRSDGTASGTRLVKDIVPGTTDGPYNSLCAAGGLVYFSVKAGFNWSLWRSDGTEAGTYSLMEVLSVIDNYNMRAWGNQLFFSPYIFDNPSHFWKTDGTVAGTVPFKAGIMTYPEVVFGTAGGGFYFCSSRGGALWQSDGTAAGTYAVADLSAGGNLYSYQEPVMVGSKIVLPASNSTHGSEMRAYDTAPPSISKPEISEITSKFAKIKVAVNPNGTTTSATLRFGPTSAYGSTINLAMGPASADRLFHGFENNLGDLMPGTLYYYEISATSAAGTRISTGTFSTLYTREAWRMAKFGSPANSGAAADAEDPDRDGLSNLVEYAFGLNPKASDAWKLPQPYIRKGYIKMSFTQPPGISDVTYGAEWSQTMQPETWTAVSDSGSGEVHTFSVDSYFARKAFMRLTVTPK